MIGRLAFAAPLALLVVLGCLRPALPDAIREGWAGAVVASALVAAAGLSLRLRSLPSVSRPEGALLAIFPLVLALLYLQPQRIASDGIFYYAPLHSLVVDLDLDFDNEYRVLGAEPGYFQRTPTGRLPNNYSIGPALVWLPSFLLAHALGLLGLYRPTGFGYPYFTFVATTTAVVGFAGVWMLFRLLNAYFESKVALAATLLLWLATFHIWYMVFEPSMSHALAMASVTGFLLFTHRGVGGARSYLMMGALGGLVALIRWQNVLFLPVGLASSWSRRGRPSLRDLGLGAGAFLLVFTPQLLYWKALYGSFLLVPQGGGYIDWSSPQLERVLFSSRHGLLAWAPILWLGLAGIPSFARRAPVLGWGLVLSTLAALWVNASVFDWWAGASFGSRRFDGALPLFGLGLAASLAWLVPRVQKHPFAALGLLLAPFVLWNFLLMAVYFGGSVPPDGPASFRQAAADGLELLYRVTGYPFSWPASGKDLVLHGRPLSSYDLTGAGSVANNVEIRMGDTDALYLGRGWSLPRRGRGATWRETSGPSGGEIFVVLAESAPYHLALEARSPVRVEVRLNGESVGVLTLSESGEGSIEVPPKDVVSGVNRLELSAEPGKTLELYRLTLTRPGS